MKVSENVAPILAPDKSLMLEQLGVLFGRAMGGRIEITGIKASVEKVRPRHRYFNVDQLEEAADYAAELNTEHMWNVYVGAALRQDDVFPGDPADDGDFLRTYAVWADADDDDQVAVAREMYQTLGVPPAMVVVTGRIPTRRAQFWWPLESPINDIETLRATVRGIAEVLGTDRAVATGKQLMRLAGTLAWPKPNKPGRLLERTELLQPANTLREVALEQLQRAFPGRAPAPPSTGSLGLPLSHPEHLSQRERFALTLKDGGWHAGALAYTASLVQQGVAPDSIIAMAPAFQRPGYSLEQTESDLRVLVEGAVRKFAPAGMSQNPAADEASDEAEKRDAVDESDEPFCAADLTGDPPARRWIIPEWIPEGVVTSLYGDGGLGKTLLMQMLACAAAVGGTWLGLPVPASRVLAVLCEDERDELHRRQNDIKTAMGYAVGNPFERLFLWPRLGRDNTLVRWGRDGAPALTAFAEKLIARIERFDPDILILDTLADFYGGNEIDRVQVNYFVKTVLGGMIERRRRLGRALSVILLGHPSVAGKATGSGYSGSTAWNAAVRARMYLSRPEEGSSDERILTRGKANYASSGDETAIRLFYADGVLHAAEDAADGDSVLWGAKEEVVRLVDRAWVAGRPFNARKGHQRFVHVALVNEVARAGYGPHLSRQALRECLQDGAIAPGKSHGKSGYRSAKNG